MAGSIIIGALCPRVVVSFAPNAPEWLLDRRVWILASMCVLCPIAFLRKLDSLKWISYVALSAVANLVRLFPPLARKLADLRSSLQLFVVIYKFFDSTGMPPHPPVKFIDISPSFISSLPVQVRASLVTFASLISP